MQRQEVSFRDQLSHHNRESKSRWEGKLRRSPYLQDLASEHEKTEEEQRIRELISGRKGTLNKQR